MECFGVAVEDRLPFLRGRQHPDGVGAPRQLHLADLETGVAGRDAGSPIRARTPYFVVRHQFAVNLAPAHGGRIVVNRDGLAPHCPGGGFRRARLREGGQRESGQASAGCDGRCEESASGHRSFSSYWTVIGTDTSVRSQVILSRPLLPPVANNSILNFSTGAGVCARFILTRPKSCF